MEFFPSKLLFLIFILLTTPLMGQDKFLTEAEFKRAILNVKVSEDEKEIEKRQYEALRKEINLKYGNSYLGSSSNSDQSYLTQQKLFQLLTCLKHAMLNDVSSGLNCREDWRSIRKGDLEIFKRNGIILPEDFKKRLERELEEVQNDIDQYSKDDEVIIIEDYLTFEEVEPEHLNNLKVIDPSIKELSLDVTEIIIKLSKSDGIQELDGQMVTEEVIVLGEMLNLIKYECEDSETFSRDPGKLFKDFKISKFKDPSMMQEELEASNYLLGISTDEKIEKIESYKYADNGSIYYLYKGRKKESNHTWVMARLSSEGKLDFRYFVISEEQPVKTNIARGSDIKIIESIAQKNRAELNNDRKLYFQAEEGLAIKADVEEAPFIGRAIIPQAKLVIGKLNLAYKTNKSMTQTDLLVEHDRLTLSTQARPLNASWSIGSQLRLSPISGSWNFNSTVRVHNFLLGYGVNQRGDQSAQLSYVMNRNFATLQKLQKGGASATAGRHFKNGKGFVAASSDFKRVHEFKLILFVR